MSAILAALAASPASAAEPDTGVFLAGTYGGPGTCGSDGTVTEARHAAPVIALDSTAWNAGGGYGHLSMARAGTGNLTLCGSANPSGPLHEAGVDWFCSNLAISDVGGRLDFPGSANDIEVTDGAGDMAGAVHSALTIRGRYSRAGGETGDFLLTAWVQDIAYCPGMLTNGTIALIPDPS